MTKQACGNGNNASCENTGKKVYIETYGCQMNVSDSEVILSILKDEGYERTETMEDADIILANTCSVRDNAEQRVLGRIDEFKGERKKDENVIIGIVGCMAERLKDKLIKEKQVTLVAGPDAYRHLPEMLKNISPKNPQMNVKLSKTETYDDIYPKRLDKNGVSAFVSIMRGCNNVCSYCVVPFTRGPERSREPHSIIREACAAFHDGYKEVTLLGQNVDSYLWKATTPGEKDVTFAELLAMTAEINPKLRVRFSTSNPHDITDDVIETMGKYPNICKHIHLPVQSGSDKMLKLMRRKYSREWYLGRIKKIREVMPDCSITTDIIAGFCTETEEDHKDTLSIMEEVKFDYAFMFQYSVRPGTLASRKYEDDVPEEVKSRRLSEIIELQAKLSYESNLNDIGKTFEVLVEGPSKKNPEEELCGRASNNKMCVFPGGGHKAGDYAIVKVEKCTPATLICSLIK